MIFIKIYDNIYIINLVKNIIMVKLNFNALKKSEIETEKEAVNLVKEIKQDDIPKEIKTNITDEDIISWEISTEKKETKKSNKISLASLSWKVKKETKKVNEKNEVNNIEIEKIENKTDNTKNEIKKIEAKNTKSDNTEKKEDIMIIENNKIKDNKDWVDCKINEEWEENCKVDFKEIDEVEKHIKKETEDNKADVKKETKKVIWKYDPEDDYKNILNNIKNWWEKKETKKRNKFNKKIFIWFWIWIVILGLLVWWYLYTWKTNHIKNTKTNVLEIKKEKPKEIKTKKEDTKKVEKIKEDIKKNKDNIKTIEEIKKTDEIKKEFKKKINNILLEKYRQK